MPSDASHALQTVIVVPAYNESQAIAGVLSKLCAVAYPVIVVDDGSKDDTVEIASRYPVHILKHPFNMGQGAALQTGIEYALTIGAQIIVTFDADGQHEPGDIPRLIEPIAAKKADVVFGSRFAGSAQNMPWLRKCLVKMMALVFGGLYKLTISDVNCGIRAFSASAAARIHITQNGMAHTLQIIEQVLGNNIAYAEVPVTIHYTEYSLAKGQKLSDGMRLLFDWVTR